VFTNALIAVVRNYKQYGTDHEECIELLIRYWSNFRRGARYDVENDEGTNLLMMAC
jgi:hypothetical protein